MSLVVARAIGLVTVQDLGRPGRMHEAISPGGALVPTLLVAANRRAGNADGAAALEILGRATVRAEADVVVATDSARARTLAAGAELELGSDGHRAAYLAPRGGIATPVFLGGRGALVWAKLGPILRAGSRIELDAERASSSLLPPPQLDLTSPIRVIAGPDLDAFTAALPAGPYRVLPASDRVGTRLAGPGLAHRPGYTPRSRPMVRGAIEIPPDGQPIVLGPENPTTGGYPLAGVIAHADLDRFFAIRVGGERTFAITRDV